MATRPVLSLSVALALALSVGCGDPEFVVPGVLSVDFYPPNGSVEISVNVQGLLAFSHEVATPDIAAADIGLVCLGSPDPAVGCLDPEPADCPATTSTSVAFDQDGLQARVTPGASLQTDTCYVYTVAKGIESTDANVGPLPADRRSVFRTN